MCIRDRVRLLDYIPDSNGEQQRLEGLMRKSRLSLAEAKELSLIHI